MVLSFSVAYYWDANFGIYSGMQMAQAQPDFRLTENLLGLNSGPQKFFDLKIVLLNFPPKHSICLICFIIVWNNQTGSFWVFWNAKFQNFLGLNPMPSFFSYKYLRFLGSVEVWFLVWNGAKMDHSECFEVQNSKKFRGDPPAAITLASRVWLATLVCSANFQAHRQTSVFIPVRFPDGKYLQAEEAAPAGCKHFCRPLV